MTDSQAQVWFKKLAETQRLLSEILTEYATIQDDNYFLLELPTSLSKAISQINRCQMMIRLAQEKEKWNTPLAERKRK